MKFSLSASIADRMDSWYPPSVATEGCWPDEGIEKIKRPRPRHNYAAPNAER
jgi:hypothetical protein